LLILSTLIAVALNQKPHQCKIQLAKDHKYFWEINDHNKIVLSEHGTWWTIIPDDQGSYITYIKAVKSGKFAQFTGVRKQLIATKDHEVGFNQRWHFFHSHGDTVIIRSRQDLSTFVTHHGLKVVSDQGITLPTEWNLVCRKS
jgi:hypothetical protein